MSNDFILDNKKDGVLEIIFNRPEKKNAITGEMYQRFHQLLLDASADKSVNVVYIRGVGKGCFSSGNDVADLNRGFDAGGNAAGDFMNTIINMDKPVIAAVSGVAIGIGATLLLHCDLVYADNEAFILMPFTQLGLCPEAGASFALPARVGPALAADMFLRNKPLTAEAAKTAGFINDIFPSDELYEKVAEIAREVASLSQPSVCATKALMKKAYSANSEKAFADEVEQFGVLLESPEAKAAFAKFLNRPKK